MKMYTFRPKLGISILMIVCSFSFFPSYGQFGKLKDLVNSKVGGLLNSSQVKLLKSDPISTNFEDCDKTKILPPTFGADSTKIDLCKIKSSNYSEAIGFTLQPGFYKGTFKSFCLKAGTYGPSKGDAYLYAPLAGKKYDLVYKLIANWEKHPNINQHQVQVLLWAIIAKTNFAKMSPDLQATAAILLSGEDIATLQNSALDYLSSEAMTKITSNLPEPAKTIVETENKIRSVMYSSNATYDQVANIAVLAGAAPVNDQFPRGLWSFHPDGYYIRYLPSGYSITHLEIYVPSAAGTIHFLPVGDVAVPANTGAQRLGQSNLMICED